MFTRILVANRGEIALRIIRTLQKMGVESVAVFSEADRLAPHVLEADRSVCIGGPSVKESYLDISKILTAAKDTGADAVIPGYGFLSENPAFASECEAAGIGFIGPEPEQLKSFGLKHTAREIAAENSVPLLPGTDLLDSSEEALNEAAAIGYPVMIKSTAGGGGIGMALCYTSSDLDEAFSRIKRLGKNNFADSGVFLEKYVAQARHVEVQIFGDGKGGAVVLGDRDCSLQRRNQKVVEETPAPGLSDAVRNELHASALRLAKGASYRSAGTVEFILDTGTNEFYFLEVNTRLQVEHTVTEETFNVDLVEWMVKLAAGEMENLEAFNLKQSGAALQVRLYAEDPGKDFQPTGGVLTEVVFPDNARIDSWISAGTEVTSHYDPLLAKIIVKGPDRKSVIDAMVKALGATSISGVETNLDYLRTIMELDAFRKGRVYTGLLGTMNYTIRGIDVISPGIATTVQDYPGRTGYWQVGVPPSGPMDSFSFRLGNRLLGNSDEAAGLEMVLGGPILKFRAKTRICITGAEIPASVDGRTVSCGEVVEVNEGETLKIGMIQGGGQRSYLLIEGGLDVPLYLGSCSTFTLGVFGGHGGRALRTGDVLRFNPGTGSRSAETGRLPENLKPVIGSDWEIKVIYGPHGAPDFFTPQGMEDFFAATWEVHYNSDRTGVRLIGPTPRWARPDGGEAGLHPSNIHDNAYMVGAVDFTGDMPVILGPDGPSLGGFVCPVTIIQAEQWKMGQLKPGDRVSFKPVSDRYARELYLSREDAIRCLSVSSETAEDTEAELIETQPLICEFPASSDRARAVCRRCGEGAVLVELGEPVLDIALRFQIHALMLSLEEMAVPGVLEMSPGIRSLQIQFNHTVISQAELIEVLAEGLAGLAGCEELELPSRVVHLPLSWDDEATRLAIEKYTATVRPGAPWCPSNIEFIRRINGLDSGEAVKEILFEASYLVMGLGDVYLGAPVATPLNPAHRLVTTKYNPARTWTPENAVGIGGAYLCVYGMEGPGGYQFVGRTLQMWNRYHQTNCFTDGKPWLLRFFDQIRFYPVSHEELMDIRRDFPLGLFTPQIEETTFKLSDYYELIEEKSEDILTFSTTQKAAFQAEREEWERTGQANFSAEQHSTGSGERLEQTIGVGCLGIETPVSGSVWKQAVSAGMEVCEGDTLIIMESMKTEIAVPSPCSGIVEEILCAEGEHINAGGLLASLRPAE